MGRCLVLHKIFDSLSWKSLNFFLKAGRNRIRDSKAYQPSSFLRSATKRLDSPGKLKKERPVPRILIFEPTFDYSLSLNEASMDRVLSASHL